MKFGIRTPSIKSSIKARTTGRIKRTVNSSVNPLYGKKGMGYVNNPQKAVYNKVYNKTTVSTTQLFDNNFDDINIETKTNSRLFQAIFLCILFFIIGIVGHFIGEKVRNSI